MMTIFSHEVRQNRKSFVIWVSIVAGLIVMMVFLFPTVKEQMQEMADTFANMAGFSAAFNMDKINVADLMGFYAVEAGQIIALAGGMYGALLGSSVLAKEEGMHTSEFLFSHPLKRTTIMRGKLLFVVTQLIVFNLLCFITALTAMEIVKETYDASAIALFHVAQTIMHIQIAGICFGISAFTKKANIGVGLGFAALLYFTNIFANVSNDLSFLKNITPFAYADAATIFVDKQLDGALIGLGLLVGVVCITIGFLRFQSKDLSA